MAQLDADCRPPSSTGLVDSASELLIVDGLCPQIGKLLGTATMPALRLREVANPLATISESLGREAHRDTTLHLVAHGRPGGLQLGGHWITKKSLVANAKALASWNIKRIALWSCELGRDREFLSLLSELTGAEVWATHRALSGGSEHWKLQTNDLSNAAPEPAVPFTAAAIHAWPHSLAPSIELAGLFISTNNNYKEQTNTISLAKTQESYRSLRFIQPGIDGDSFTAAQGNNVPGEVQFTTTSGEAGKIKGSITRQIKTLNGSTKDVEAYYLVTPDGFAYLLVTFDEQGGDNTSLFQPGETYRTSSDFKLRDLQASASSSPGESIDNQEGNDTVERRDNEEGEDEESSRDQRDRGKGDGRDRDDNNDSNSSDNNDDRDDRRRNRDDDSEEDSNPTTGGDDNKRNSPEDRKDNEEDEDERSSSNQRDRDRGDRDGQAPENNNDRKSTDDDNNRDGGRRNRDNDSQDDPNSTGAGGDNDGFPELEVIVDPGADPQDIEILDPGGDPLDPKSYRLEEIDDDNPDQSTFRIRLVDSDPETQGDQPFGSIYKEYLKAAEKDEGNDGRYTAVLGQRELGGVVVKTEQLSKSKREACIEALFSLDPPNNSGTIRDLITGTDVGETIALGNESTPFYADKGKRDLAIIRNFAPGQVIQLHGAANDYRLDANVTIANERGVGIFYRRDLIGIVQGQDQVFLQGLANNISSDAFAFL